MNNRGNKKEKLLYIIDDQEAIAKSLGDTIEHYLPQQFSKIINKTTIPDITQDLISGHNSSAYIVDINLGLAGHRAGIPIIQEIKKLQPNSLVIAYSGNLAIKSEAMDAGADSFIGKRRFSDSIDKIVSTLEDFIAKEAIVKAPTSHLEEQHADSAITNMVWDVTVYRWLIDGLNHELRNSLMKMSYSLRELEEQIHDQRIRISNQTRHKISRGIKEIKESARYIDDLMRNYHQLNIDEVDSVDIQETIREVVSTYARTSHVSRAGIKLQFNDITEGKRPAIIRCNKLVLSSIITNLLANSISAVMDPGVDNDNRRVIIEYDATNEFHKIIVIDSGVGIHESALGKIFEKGFSSDSRKLGMGLYIVKNLVETSLRGSITSKSKIGKGAIFVVRFPIG